MAVYLGMNDLELSIITLTVLQQLWELGEEYKDETDRNVVGLMIESMPSLMGEIRTARDHENF